MDKVRVGSVYIFERNGFDQRWSHADVKDDQWVRVVNLPSAPKANTMGQCHINDYHTGELLGMVDVRSLRRPAREYVIQANYGYGDGWEDETIEATRADAVACLKEYRANAPEYVYRLRARREKPQHVR
jgi:hypothetical protein